MESAGSTIERGLASAVARVAARDHLLVASDFDGTLAPLVDDPARARALPAAEAALVSLATLPRTEVALLSGRSLASLQPEFACMGATQTSRFLPRTEAV